MSEEFIGIEFISDWTKVRNNAGLYVGYTSTQYGEDWRTHIKDDCNHEWEAYKHSRTLKCKHCEFEPNDEYLVSHRNKNELLRITKELDKKIKDLETQLKQKEAEIKTLKVMWSELAIYVDHEHSKMIQFAIRSRSLEGVSEKMNKLYLVANLSKIDRPEGGH